MRLTAADAPLLVHDDQFRCGCKVYSCRLPCEILSRAYGRVAHAAQVLDQHPATYFLMLGRVHPSEPLAGRLVENLVDQVPSLPFVAQIEGQPSVWQASNTVCSTCRLQPCLQELITKARMHNPQLHSCQMRQCSSKQAEDHGLGKAYSTSCILHLAINQVHCRLEF